MASIGCSNRCSSRPTREPTLWPTALAHPGDASGKPFIGSSRAFATAFSRVIMVYFADVPSAGQQDA